MGELKGGGGGAYNKTLLLAEPYTKSKKVRSTLIKNSRKGKKCFPR